MDKTKEMKRYNSSSMIWSIAWKNVWRSRRRSIIVISAVCLGTIAGVFTAGLMKGWVNQRIDAVIYNEISHMQIHHPDYLLNNELKYTLPEIDQLEAALYNNEAVLHYSKRLKVNTMAATSRGNTGLMLNGIDPPAEVEVSKLHQKIVTNGGSYFDTSMNQPIVISDKTAEQLRIKNYSINQQVVDSLLLLGVDKQTLAQLTSIVDERFKTEKLFQSKLKTLLSRKEINTWGNTITEVAKHYRLRSKIVFTFNGSDGKLSYQTYRVCGIYKTNNSLFDQMNAYVLHSDLAPVAGFSQSDFHEIALLKTEDAKIKDIQKELKSDFPELSIMSWLDLSPEAAMMTQFMDLWYLIIMAVILLALAFGIINTMLMAILERTKELGMLMAIGMNNKRVFSMIMLETIFLTMVGAIIGMVLGGLLILISGHTGLNFSSVSEGFEAMGWSSMVYPTIDARFFLLVTLLVITTGMLSSLIPARKALSMHPVDAIRTE